MSKVGTPFRRDVEFTGSCDVSLRTSSRLLQRLKQRGFALDQHAMRTNYVRMSNIPRGDIAGYMEAVEAKSIQVPLNDEQKKAIESIYGWAPKTLEISVCDAEKSAEVKLTKDQQKSIAEALDIDMESLEMSRSLIEVTPR